MSKSIVQEERTYKDRYVIDYINEKDVVFVSNDIIKSAKIEYYGETNKIPNSIWSKIVSNFRSLFPDNSKNAHCMIHDLNNIL